LSVWLQICIVEQTNNAEHNLTVTNAAGSAFSHTVTMCLRVYPVHALTFESCGLETLFFVYIFRIFRSKSHISGSLGYGKIMGAKTPHICGWSTFDWKAFRSL